MGFAIRITSLELEIIQTSISGGTIPLLNITSKHKTYPECSTKKFSLLAPSILNQYGVELIHSIDKEKKSNKTKKS